MKTKTFCAVQYRYEWDWEECIYVYMSQYKRSRIFKNGDIRWEDQLYAFILLREDGTEWEWEWEWVKEWYISARKVRMITYDHIWGPELLHTPTTRHHEWRLHKTMSMNATSCVYVFVYCSSLSLDSYVQILCIYIPIFKFTHIVKLLSLKINSLGSLISSSLTCLSRTQTKLQRVEFE